MYKWCPTSRGSAGFMQWFKFEQGALWQQSNVFLYGELNPGTVWGLAASMRHSLPFPLSGDFAALSCT